MRRKELVALKQCFADFYIKRYYNIVKKYKRSYLMSIILVVIKNLESLFIIFQDSHLEQIAKKETHFNFLNQMSYIRGLIQGQNDNQIIVCSFLGFNITLLLYLISQLSYFTYLNINTNKQSLKYSQKGVASKLNKMNKSVSAKLMIQEVLSALLMLYNYIFYTPSIYFSIISIKESYSIVNAVLTLLVGALIFDIDYSYSIEEKDYLKRRYSFYSLAELLIQAIVYFIAAVESNLTFIVLFFFFLLQTLIQVWEKPYVILRVQRLIIFVSFYLALLTLTLIIYVAIQKINGKNLLSLFTLLLVPISYRFVRMLEIYEKTKIKDTLSKMKKSNFQILVQAIRQLFYQETDFSDSDGLIILNGLSNLRYSLQSNLLINQDQIRQGSTLIFKQNSQIAQNVQQQYLQEQSTSTTDSNMRYQINSSIKVIVQEEEMNEFIFHLGECFRKQVNQKEYSFEYLAFLLEIQQNYKLFWKQYCSETWGAKQSSIKEQQIMNSLLHSFENTLKRQQADKQKKEQSVFSLNFLNVIMFDESIKEAFNLLHDCFRMKANVLQMMQLRIIDLNELSSKIEELQKVIEELKLNIKFLAKLNSSHPEFSLLSSYFKTYLSFSRLDVQFDKYAHKNKVKANSSEKNQIQNHNNFYGSIVSNIQEYQGKNSCIVFTSLLHEQSHLIKKTSFNFSKIFKMKYQLALNRPIDILMPLEFQSVHPKYISEFMECSSILKQKSSTMVFGQQHDGYIFACTIDVRINKVDLFNDFGITTMIKRINLNKDYLLFNASSMKLISITNSIHKYIFRSHRKFTGITVDRHFPFINQQILELIFKRQNEINKYSQQLHQQQLIVNEEIENKYFFLKNSFAFVFIEDTLKTENIKHQTNTVLDKVHFLLLEIQIKKAEYKYLDNIYYIEISQLQQLDTEKDYKLIQEQLQSLLYSSSALSVQTQKIVNYFKVFNEVVYNTQEYNEVENYLNTSKGGAEYIKNNLDEQVIGQDINNLSKRDTDNFQLQSNRILSNENLIFAASKDYQLLQSNMQLSSPFYEGYRNTLLVSPTSNHPLQISQNENVKQFFYPTEEETKDKIPQQQQSSKNIQYNQRFADKNSVVDFSVINTLGLNNSLSIEAGEDIVTINSFQEQKKNQIQLRQQQLDQLNEKQEKIRQSLSTIRYIQDIMDQKIKLKTITVFQIIAFISFLATFILTFQQFFSLLSSVETYQQDFQLVTWPSLFQGEMANIQKSINLQQLVMQNNFTSISKSNFINMNNTINNYLGVVVDDLHDLMYEMEGLNSNRPIFTLLKEQPVVYTWPSFKYTGMDPQGKFFQITYNTELHFGVLLINLQILRYIAGVGGGRPEYFMILNEIVFLQAFNQVQQQAVTYSNQTLLDIKSQLDTMLILTLVITSFCLGIQFPIYYFIQVERQSILKLFTTFNVQLTGKILERMKNITQNSSLLGGVSENAGGQNRKSMFQLNWELNANANTNNISVQAAASMNNKKQSESTDSRIKKQNISEYVQLQKMDNSFIRRIIFFYALIIVYPIVNKIISAQYIDEQIMDLNNLVSIYQLKAQILNSLGMNYYCLTLKIYPSLQPMKVNWYYDNLNSIIKTNQQMGQQLQNLTNTLKNSYNYQKSQYDDIFFPIIQGDICATLKKFNQFNSTEEANNCSTYYNGVLTQGVLLSLNELTDKLVDFNNFYQLNTTSKTYKQQLNSFFTTFDFYGFHQFSLILDQSIDYIGQLINTTNRSYYNFFILFQSSCLVYQLVVITLVFLIQQVMFYKSINNKINQTKRYLKVIDIKSLLSNPFIINYFKKNIKK